MNTITLAKNSSHPLTVNRLGYGTMRLTGEGFYGEPPNRPEALAILKCAVESGVQFIDTADYYGDDVTNRLIAEALYPYQDDLVICTKVGATRKPDKSWVLFNSPANLRVAIERNLRTLKMDQVQLVHYRVMPGHASLEAGLEALFQMQREGKILHVGVSNVTREELETAMTIGDIVSVENMYSHAKRDGLNLPHNENRGGEDILSICEQHDIVMIPYWSLHNALPKSDDRIAQIAKKHSATEAQINIAWLLHRSPNMLPIPGTSSLAHFEENRKAVDINLTNEDMAFLG